jgi:hypothetical protein
MKTYTEIIVFLNAGQTYLIAHDKVESKLKYALKRMIKTCTKLYETYTESVEDLRIEHCSIDATKGDVILYNANGSYAFTRDGLRAFTKATRALREQAVEVAPFLAQAVPDDLTDDERAAFAGFVLPPEAEPLA